MLEIVGHLGRATSRQVWGRLLSQGCVCKRKTVSVMLLRCSRQGLMKRKRKGRDFFYRLSDSGWRRLKYLKNAKNADSDIIKLPMHYGCWAMIEILTSSDPTLRSFSSFLIWLHNFHHVPPKKLVELSVEFLLSTRTISQPQLPQSAKFNRDLLSIWAFKRLSDISDEEDYMQMQLLSKQASQPSEDVLKELAETRIETNKLLREVIEADFGRRNITKPAKEPKSHFDKRLSETEPYISTSKRTSIKHSTATYEKAPSDYSVVPPPALQPAILKLISKAKEIILDARCKDISKDVIAGLEKASSRGSQ